MPRSTASKTAAPSTTMTTASIPSPVVTSVVSITTTATTLAPISPLLKLQIADLEMERYQKQYACEAEFAQNQKSKVGRLKDWELKEARDDIKALKAELGTYRAQAPPPQTMAQYQHVPPGQQYGSPIQTSTMAQGHYSLATVPYAGAANLTASPGQTASPMGSQPRARRSTGLRNHRARLPY